MMYKELLAISGIRRISIKVTNQCNLSCNHCSNSTWKPIDENSENVFRRKIDEMSVADIELFCERFKGIGHKEIHGFTSAEPTTLAPEKLGEMIEILYNDDRIVELDTNGFGLMCMDPKHLNLIKKIAIDDHGTNHSHVADCYVWLKKNYKGEVHYHTTPWHYDLQQAMDNKCNTPEIQKACSTFLTEMTLRGRVIYPCVNVYNVSVWMNKPQLRDDMIKAGWTLDNPNIVQAIKNWRESIPAYSHELCQKHCWYPQFKISDKIPIRLHPTDKLAKDCEKSLKN